MKIDEAARALVHLCHNEHCNNCRFGMVIPGQVTMCRIRCPISWELEKPAESVEDDEIQHVGYTDEQLGREK